MFDDVFPDGVILEVASPRDAPGTVAALHPAEARAIAGAGALRSEAFARARACARRALARLGTNDAPIVSADDGAPCWPDGVVGSLSHRDGWAAAAVARSAAFAAIGLDLERAGVLDPGMLPLFATVTERAWLATVPAAGRGACARRLWSAREAALKCARGALGRVSSDTAIEVAFAPDRSRFRAVCRPERGTRTLGMIGRVRSDAGMTCAGVVLERG